MSTWRHEPVFNYIKESFSKENDYILELGVGNGLMIHKLSISGFKHLCFIDKEIETIFKEVDKFGKIRDLNHEQIPIVDKTYDLVIALQILEHLENPCHFERECARVLRSGGMLILSVPYIHSLASKLRFFLKGNLVRYEKDNEHITALSKNVFNKIFLKDFVIEKIDYTRPTLKNFKIRLNLPNWKILKELFSTNIYYYMRKI